MAAGVAEQLLHFSCCTAGALNPENGLPTGAPFAQGKPLAVLSYIPTAAELQAEGMKPPGPGEPLIQMLFIVIEDFNIPLSPEVTITPHPTQPLGTNYAIYLPTLPESSDPGNPAPLNSALWIQIDVQNADEQNHLTSFDELLKTATNKEIGYGPVDPEGHDPCAPATVPEAQPEGYQQDRTSSLVPAPEQEPASGGKRRLLGSVWNKTKAVTAIAKAKAPKSFGEVAHGARTLTVGAVAKIQSVQGKAEGAIVGRTEHYIGTTRPTDTPVYVPPLAMNTVTTIRGISRTGVVVSEKAARTMIRVSCFFGRAAGGGLLGKAQYAGYVPGVDGGGVKDAAIATVGGVATVTLTAAGAALSILRTGIHSTSQVVAHRYGNDAGRLTSEGLGVVGDAAQATANIETAGAQAALQSTQQMH